MHFASVMPIGFKGGHMKMKTEEENIYFWLTLFSAHLRLKLKECVFCLCNKSACAPECLRIQGISIGKDRLSFVATLIIRKCSDSVFEADNM